MAVRGTCLDLSSAGSVRCAGQRTLSAAGDCAQGKQPGRTPAHLNGHRDSAGGWQRAGHGSGIVTRPHRDLRSRRRRRPAVRRDASLDTNAAHLTTRARPGPQPDAAPTVHSGFLSNFT